MRTWNRHSGGPVLSWYGELQGIGGAGPAQPTKVPVSQSRPHMFRVLYPRRPWLASRAPCVASRVSLPRLLA